MNIQPLSIWKDGQEIVVTILELTLVNDNLTNRALFNYALCQDGFEMGNRQIVSGNLEMTNPDYDNWNDGSDINYAAYVWAASKLNLQLIN